MKKTFRLSVLLILLTLLFVPLRSAQAQGPNPDGGGQVIFGSNYTVKSGDTFEGDLVVFGGNVTLEEDATLNGDLVVIGGTIRSNGKATGSMVVVGGQVSLEKSAFVGKDVVTIGGQLDKAEEAVVKGNIVNNAAPNISVPSARIPPTAPAPSYLPNIPVPHINIGFMNPLNFFWVFGISAFAMLLALFLQPQLERTGQAMVSQPLMMGAVGLASVIGSAATIVLLFLLVPLLWLFGVISMGLEVGERFTKAINQTWSPVLNVGFGTFLLMLAGSVIKEIPCLGALVLFLLGLVAVGATVLTLFGTRPAQIPALTVSASPNDPSAGSVPPVG